jgi:hypothetical protein
LRLVKVTIRQIAKRVFFILRACWFPQCYEKYS